MEKVIHRDFPAPAFDAGAAYWNQRAALAGDRAGIEGLFRAVGHPGDLFLTQWAQLMAVCLEFKPDLVIELGRGRGNSTCAFAESFRLLGPENRSLLSLCLADDWERLTRPNVSKLVDAAWFRPLHIRTEDILSFDFEPWTRNAGRCLVFWDAHGFEIAECVLGKILPLLAEKEHLVVMHDLSDARWGDPKNYYYGDRGLWKGNDWSGPRLRIGHIDTAVEQAVAAVDFLSRNGVPLRSADEDIRNFFGDAEKKRDIENALGPEMFSLSAHWFHFSLNERSGTFTFPKFDRPAPVPVSGYPVGLKSADDAGPGQPGKRRPGEWLDGLRELRFRFGRLKRRMGNRQG